METYNRPLPIETPHASEIYGFRRHMPQVIKERAEEYQPKIFINNLHFINN